MVTATGAQAWELQITAFGSPVRAQPGRTEKISGLPCQSAATCACAQRRIDQHQLVVQPLIGVGPMTRPHTYAAA